MAVDIFLKIPPIKGESRDDQHKEEIDILAWSWGMSQSGTMHMGGGGGAGKVNMQDMSLTKYVDKATTDLIKRCCTGEHLEKAELFVRKAGGNPLEYFVVELHEVLISSYQTGGSGADDRVTENLSLNFAKVKVIYRPQNEKGDQDGEMEAVWNIAENKDSI